MILLIKTFTIIKINYIIKSLKYNFREINGGKIVVGAGESSGLH